MAQTPKRPRDPNQLAKFIVDTVTADDPRKQVHPPLARKVASGGLKGGPARAAKLTPERRSAIAAKAAAARWKKPPDGPKR